MRLSDSQRQFVAKWGLAVIMMAVLVVVILVLLWIDSWWPDRLIPWVPFDRI